MKQFTLLVILILLRISAGSQDLTGLWEGELLQNEQYAAFEYRLEIVQKASVISGSATSQSKQGGPVSKFEIGGSWDGQQMVLQEVRQIEPKNSQWCLKHILLNLSITDTLATLRGTWEAQNCIPGTISLSKRLPANSKPQTSSDSYRSQTSNSKLSGKWSGQLSQSDRSYGFYFEMKLNTDGTGTSTIISDGEGGNATLSLNWNFDDSSGLMHFKETAIIEKSVPDWRWCLKSGQLKMKETVHWKSMQGSWAGYIEGYSESRGACAPGELFLEQPILNSGELILPDISTTSDHPTLNPVPPDLAGYVKDQKREVEVNRVVEVKGRRIKIWVWDNGTIDGDVLSLFLNGKMLLHQHRATRQKYEMLVTLEKPVNYLILHAITLGSISPNTVAVSIDDGSGEKIIMVSSTLKSSGAIMIREFKVE